jgi:hypothetical protein
MGCWKAYCDTGREGGAVTGCVTLRVTTAQTAMTMEMAATTEPTRMPMPMGAERPKSRAEEGAGLATGVYRPPGPSGRAVHHTTSHHITPQGCTDLPDRQGELYITPHHTTASHTGAVGVQHLMLSCSGQARCGPHRQLQSRMAIDDKLLTLTSCYIPNHHKHNLKELLSFSPL